MTARSRPFLIGGALLAWMAIAALVMGAFVEGPGLKLPVLLES
ncbi:MAG: hypothetical protein V7636_2629, partial [Actinomycetota bacterium]